LGFGVNAEEPLTGAWEARIALARLFSISRAMPRNDRSKDRRPEQKPERKSDRRPEHRTEKKPFHKPQAERPTGLWLYGIHSVRAALANPKRHVKRVVLTTHAAEEIGKSLLGRTKHEIVDMDAVSKLLPPGSVHQGVALHCEPLPRRDLADVLPEPGNKRRIVLVLDQITDPHNEGAILRSAAAFGVAAVIVQDRHAPPESGVLAKAASGGLDSVPYIVVVNISRALDELAELGFWRIALAGDGEQSLQDAMPKGDAVLVLGSEGAGIRRLVREHCDTAAFIPIANEMESLNVSNAAAVALYELRRG
jgi:23S rRNA (guanosine2251-2'-O)-methyltransferase